MTALYLNMVYYTIRISPLIKYMTTIVTVFGKFRYNHLPMSMCNTGDIFQSKIDELPSDIEGVKTYTDDTLVLSK